MFDLGIIDELTYHNDVRELYNEMKASTRPISLAVVGDAATKAPSQSPGSPASTTSQRDPANFTEEPDATRANASGSDSLPTSGVLLARGAAPSQAYVFPEHNTPWIEFMHSILLGFDFRSQIVSLSCCCVFL
mmetsp:Transcript_11572/g.29258  ORF Transcript_11572/g.29258 Transcript_11572/m.29258 type:complete len:133 (+) Transcript_11572:810-1208(+)